MRSLEYWGPLILWTGVILWASNDVFSSGSTSGWLSTILGAEVPHILNVTIRKLAHLFEYAVLALLAWRAIRSEIDDPDAQPRLTMLVPMAIALAVALTDESLQSLSAARSGSLWDVLLDLTGAAIAIAIVSRQ